MNLANKITLLRILMVPIFVLVTYVVEDPYMKWIAVAIFAIASITDWLDGYIARKYNMISTFGKYMDPLADKILVAAALIYMVEASLISGWVVSIIISREFIVSGLRLVAGDKGIVLAASYWGKAKTVVTMIMIIVVMLGLEFPFNDLVNDILIYSAVALTVISAVDYIMKNKSVFK